MKLRFGALSLAALVAAPSFADDSFEFHGYFRSGIGSSDAGTDQVCYKLPRGHGNVFRFGNECGMYGEISLQKHFKGKSETDPWFMADVTWAFASPSDDAYEEIGEEATFWHVQTFVEAGNLIGNGSKIWIGKRFYERRGVGINDLWYIESRGPGAGAYDIPLGPGTFDFAVFRNTKEDHPVQTTVDVRYDLNLGYGSLETVLMMGSSSNRHNETGDDAFEPLKGESITLTHSFDKKSIANKFVVQYGTGLFGAIPSVGEGTTLNEWNNIEAVAKGQKEAKKYREESSSMRIIDEISYTTEDYALVAAFTHLTASFGGVKDASGQEVEDRTVTSFAIRPYYFFNENYAVAFDAGTETIKNPWSTAEGQALKKDWTLTKYTLAFNIRPAKGWDSRPELRFFATQANWNDDAKGIAPSSNYTGTDGFSVGAQAEVWW